jgi:hypothetical protein
MIIGNKTSRLTTNLRFGLPVTLIKKGAGAYDASGLYQDGATEATTVTAHHQPATEDDRMNLPEGERVSEAITVYIKTDDRDLVRPMRQGVDNSAGDIFQIGGINYEVYSVDNYSSDKHIKALCMRRDNQDG